MKKIAVLVSILSVTLLASCGKAKEVETNTWKTSTNTEVMSGVEENTSTWMEDMTSTWTGVEIATSTGETLELQVEWNIQ